MLFIFPYISFAEFQSADEIARQLISLNKGNSLQRRLEIQSGALLNKPYLSGALGEGVLGKYDKNPLYRFDSFDCETYIDTVIALALAKNFSDFKDKMNRIRYKQANVDFIQRNHFPSADWIPTNRRNGYIDELTYFIAGRKTSVTSVLINRRGWYQRLTTDRIRIPQLSSQEKMARLLQLKNEANKRSEANKVVAIAYIPVLELLHNPELTKKIPSGSLLFFVGHDARLSSRIGTHMNVLHMSFAIWNKGKLYCRMASSMAGKVQDVFFQAYLKTYLPLGTLDGISVWTVKGQEE